MFIIIGTTTINKSKKDKKIQEAIQGVNNNFKADLIVPDSNSPEGEEIFPIIPCKCRNEHPENMGEIHIVGFHKNGRFFIGICSACAKIVYLPVINNQQQ